MGEDDLLTPGDDPLLGKLVQDKYEIVRKIGEGGMGAVYAGQHKLINRPVAIKCLHSTLARNPEIVTRFQREAMAANAIRHENIVEITDLGRLDDGSVFMVLEFLEGIEFAELIEKEGALPIGRVVHIVSQACDALTAAHDKNIVHRDLKPENVFLIPRGGTKDFVKVLDFGIAKFREGMDDKITKTGTAMGTPFYMAPEQVQGSKDVDHRADIYAMGVILFHALTGRFPFDAGSFPLLVVKICSEPAPSVSLFRRDVPEALDRLISKMLEKDPDERPQSCAEVKSALAPFTNVDDVPKLVDPSVAFDETAASLPGLADPQTAKQGGVGPDAEPVEEAETTASPASAIPASTPVHHSDVGGGPNRSPFLSVGVVVALLGIGGLGAFVATGGFGREDADEPDSIAAEAPEGEAGASADPPDEPASSPSAVDSTGGLLVTIAVTPADAELFLDGRRVDNPFADELPRSDEPRLIEARRAGYTTVQRELDLSGDSVDPIRIALERERRGGRRRPTMRSHGSAAAPTMEAAPAMEETTMEEEAPSMMERGIMFLDVQLGMR